MNNSPNTKKLRRAYTRTIPTTLRTISQLEESMKDVETQWYNICNEFTNELENNSLKIIIIKTAKITLRKVREITSQLKAVKQELVPRINDIIKREEKENEDQTFMNFCKSLAGNNNNNNNNISSSSSPSSSSKEITPCNSSHNALQNSNTTNEKLQFIKLIIKVWVWSICLSIIQNDMELLSESLSFALSCNLLKENLKNYISYEAYGFFLGESTKDIFVLSDGYLLHICALFYYLFTHDDAAAEVSFRNLNLIIEESKEISSKEEEINYLFLIIKKIAEWIATEDYGALHSCLIRNISLNNNNNNNNNYYTYSSEQQKEKEDKNKKLNLPPLLIFFIQTMMNVVVHKQLIQHNYQNIWRPKINMNLTETKSNSSEKDNNNDNNTNSLLLLLTNIKNPVLRVCKVIQHESLPSSRSPWPLPDILFKTCFEYN